MVVDATWMFGAARDFLGDSFASALRGRIGEVELAAVTAF